jgi:hypothetical protein
VDFTTGRITAYFVVHHIWPNFRSLESLLRLSEEVGNKENYVSKSYALHLCCTVHVCFWLSNFRSLSFSAPIFYKSGHILTCTIIRRVKRKTINKSKRDSSHRMRAQLAWGRERGDRCMRKLREPLYKHWASLADNWLWNLLATQRNMDISRVCNYYMYHWLFVIYDSQHFI